MKQAPPRAPQSDLARSIKAAIAGRVIALFNDRSRGEAPVTRRADGLFGPTAVAWRVHGDVTSMMVGGISSLLLQMLHPAVLAGVWDHSNFRTDMHGRLRRTARFIALTTYGGRNEAEAVIARVRSFHDRVRGTLPDGTPYAANDPALLAWVHVTAATSFLNAWRRYVEPGMSAADQDRSSPVKNVGSLGTPWLFEICKYSRLQGPCPQQAKSLQIRAPVAASRAA
jgi:uncharacterized protein (DUF2236 family)